jgi:hypothetical protein
MKSATYTHKKSFEAVLILTFDTIEFVTFQSNYRNQQKWAIDLIEQWWSYAGDRKREPKSHVKKALMDLWR